MSPYGTIGGHPGNPPSTASSRAENQRHAGAGADQDLVLGDAASARSQSRVRDGLLAIEGQESRADRAFCPSRPSRLGDSDPAATPATEPMHRKHHALRVTVL
jgi:hypothetical protein